MENNIINQGRKYAYYFLPILLLTSCQAKKGMGTTFLGFIIMFFAPLLLSIIIVLFRNEKTRLKKLKETTQKISFKRFRTPVVTAGILLFSLFVANFLPLEKDKSPEEAFLQDVHAMDHGSALINYKKAFLNDEDNTANLLDMAYSLSLIKELPDWNALPFDIEVLEKGDTNLLQQIRVGSAWLMSKNEYYLYQVVDRLPNEGYGVNFFRGVYESDKENYSKAITYFEDEIEANGFKRGAVRELSLLHYGLGNSKKLDSLISNKELNEFVPLNIRKERYYYNGNVGEYVKAVIGRHTSKVNVFGLIGSCLILGCWLMFFRLVNPFYKASILGTVVVLLTSVIVTFNANFIYDYLHFTLGFTKSDNLFLYSIFGIGLIEEAIKAIPFLIAFLFIKDFDEPFSYIYYAGISALGFAFIENFAVYFDSDSISVVQSRGFIACFGHVFALSILGYLLMLARFKYNWSRVGAFFIGLSVAAISHGLYDYIIFIEVPTIIFMLFFFILVKIWVTMANNGLNLSKHFEWEKLNQYSEIKFIFGVSLMSIIVGEYLLLTFQMGAEVANDALAGSIFSGLILAVYIGLSLTNFDFFPSYVERIRPPYQISDIVFPGIVNSEHFIGSNIRLVKSKYSKPKFLLPAEGVIISRHMVNGDSDWYLVKLFNPLDVKPTIVKTHVLMHFEEYDASLKEFIKCEIACSTINVKADLGKIVINRKMLSNKFTAFVKELE